MSPEPVHNPLLSAYIMGFINIECYQTEESVIFSRLHIRMELARLENLSTIGLCDELVLMAKHPGVRRQVAQLRGEDASRLLTLLEKVCK